MMSRTSKLSPIIEIFPSPIPSLRSLLEYYTLSESSAGYRLKKNSVPSVVDAFAHPLPQGARDNRRRSDSAAIIRTVTVSTLLLQ